MARVPGGFGINDVMGVRRGPSRGVSLDDVRDLPVQTMGFDWVYTDYGYETTSPGGTKVRITGPHKGNEAGSRGGKYWSIEDTEGKNVKGIGEYQPTLRDAKRVAEESVPRHDEGEEKLRVAEEENARKVAQIREERQRQRESRMDLNTAMAGGGQESLPEMSPEEIAREAQRKINREGLAGARRALEQGPLRVPDHLDDFVPEEDYGGDPLQMGNVGDWVTLRDGTRARIASVDKHPPEWWDKFWEQRNAGYPELWDSEEGQSERQRKVDKWMEGRIDSDEPDDLNPQSQMSQTMLADMFAQQAAQPQQGYFGGLGQAVGGMSTQQKIALLVGLGLLTGGTSTPLMAPALGVGAGLAFTQ